MSTTAPDDMIPVLVGPGTLVNVRMPTRAERQALGILAPDVPIFGIMRPGKAEELFDARLVEIMVDGPQAMIRSAPHVGPAAVVELTALSLQERPVILGAARRGRPRRPSTS